MAVRELHDPPGMLPLFARAGAALIPGASRLPFIGGRGEATPDLLLELSDVTIDRDRLAAYNRVCGFPLRDSLPATYLHVVAFPLHLALMTDGSFPFPAIGLVHIANEIRQHRPVGLDETVQIRVWATPVEPHPRGQQFSLRSEARVGDELVWEDTSTNLRRGAKGSGGEPAERGSDGESKSPADDLPATATWKLPADLGRRYGSVSGDLNPIHVHPLTARLFGFPTAIAHGMWTKARCLAALDAELPDRFSVDVRFRKPILLPGTVEFGEVPSDRGIRFGVRGARKGTPHLNGTASFD